MRTSPSRPLMLLCAVYVCALGGLFCISAFSFLPVLCGLAGIAVFLLLAELPGVRLKRSFCIMGAAVILLALALSQKTVADYRTFQAMEPRDVTLVGKVETLHYANDSGAALVLDVKTMDGERVSGKVIISSYGENARYAESGETVSCRVTLGEEESLADYEEYRTYNFADGIYAAASITDAETFTVLKSAGGFGALCDKIASYCRRTFLTYLDEDSAALVTGLLLGDKSALPADVKRDFRRVGLSHVLAVSGLHLSILLGGLQKFLNSIRLHRRIQLCITFAFLLLFMGVTGFYPSILRAGIMWMLCSAAFLMGGNADSLTALSFAAAIICIFSPNAVSDIGFLLSVSATLGILLLAEPLEAVLSAHLPTDRILPWGLHTVLSLCGITFAATVFTLPVTLFAFGELSLVAPLANLLMNPFVTVVLVLAPLIILASLLPFSFAASFLSVFAGGAAKMMMTLAAWLSSYKNAVAGVRYPFLVPLFVLFILCAVTMTVLFTRKRGRRSILCVYPVYFIFCTVFAVSISVYSALTAGQVKIDVQVYKKNDIVTVTTGGMGLLIDASDGAYTSAKYGWEQLSAQNITQLDGYLLTHYHTKHTATAAKLARNTLIGTLLLPTPETDEEKAVYDALVRVAKNAGIAVQTYTRGAETVVFGRAEITVFPREMLDRSAQPLYGYTIEKYADNDTDTGKTFLCLGSASFEAESASAFAEMRDAALLTADILFCGVHGPLVKSAFNGTTENKLAALLFANEELRTFCGTDLSSEAQTVCTLTETDGCSVILK